MVDMAEIGTEMARASAKLGWDSSRLSYEVNSLRTYQKDRRVHFPSAIEHWENDRNAPSPGETKLLMHALIGQNKTVTNGVEAAVEEERLFRVLRTKIEAVRDGHETSHPHMQALGTVMKELRERNGDTPETLTARFNAYVHDVDKRPEPAFVSPQEIEAVEKGKAFKPELVKDMLHALVYHGGITANRSSQLQQSYEFGVPLRQR